MGDPDPARCGPRATPPPPAAATPTPLETRQALERRDLATARIGLEHGITLDPLNPELYLQLTRLYAGSTQPIWSLLYGEAFLLLELWSSAPHGRAPWWTVVVPPASPSAL